MSWVVHLVIGGGAVADDLYVGPFRYEDRAQARADELQLYFDKRGAEISCLVRPMVRPRTAAGRLLEDIGW